MEESLKLSQTENIISDFKDSSRILLEIIKLDRKNHENRLSRNSRNLSSMSFQKQEAQETKGTTKSNQIFLKLFKSIDGNHRKWEKKKSSKITALRNLKT